MLLEVPSNLYKSVNVDILMDLYCCPHYNLLSVVMIVFHKALGV